jgi:hypothetical protein
MKSLSKTLSCTLLAICTLFALPLTAQVVVTDAPPPPEPPAGPITIIDWEEMIYDFGFIEEGTIVTHVFTFTNSGDHPLVLSNAKGSCGCTVPAWPKGPIFPGETASITVEFNSKGKRGKRNQRITITANTDPAQTFLSMQGEIIVAPATEEPATDLTLTKDPSPSPDCFAIYPNPTADVLKLEITPENIGMPAVITINSMTGQTMAQRKFASLSVSEEFSVDHYPAGTYIALVQIGDQQPEARCFVVVD